MRPFSFRRRQYAIVCAYQDCTFATIHYKRRKGKINYRTSLAHRQTQLVELTVVYEARDHSTRNAKPNTSPPYV